MKNFKKILTTISMLGLTAVTTTNITACSLTGLTSKFQELNNWKENNGEIQSLINDKIQFISEQKLVMVKINYLKV